MDRFTATFLEHEARALLTRLANIRPFVLSETMVPAANLAPEAQVAIDGFLARGRSRLRGEVLAFLDHLCGAAARLPAAQAQRRFTSLRMRFNAVLTQFDIFADAVSQRSTQQRGVWLSGLDRLALDALALPGVYEAPPVVCYLDRGVSAAIRRARTRLPGGGENPVAVIRVPRERMVGSAIASSLVHEVGHQAAALLDLVAASRRQLRARAGRSARGHWAYWERWISEIVADLWSVANLAAASTLGLMTVLSLPSAFVFRVSLDDPHPPPWLRVKLSCAIGQALYPDPQWDRLFELWNALHPLREEDTLLAHLHDAAPELVAVLLELRPPSLDGRSLADVVRGDALRRDRLADRYRCAQSEPAALIDAAPCVACATLGQARIDQLLDPEAESRLVDRLLVRWALHNTLLGPHVARAAGSTPILNQAGDTTWQTTRSRAPSASRRRTPTTPARWPVW